MTRVGFWDPRRHPEVEAMMPWDDASLANKRPIASTRALDRSLLDQLAKAEGGALRVSCFGSSWCRVCGASNGSVEYTAGGFVWPSGYRHYLEAHNVAVDPDFEAWLKRLP